MCKCKFQNHTTISLRKYKELVTSDNHLQKQNFNTITRLFFHFSSGIMNL